MTSDRVLMESLEPRTLFSAGAAVAPAELVAQANNAFAFDLFRQLSKTNTGNVFFSPYSADTALEMALQGAKGVTATEMIQALHLPQSDLAQAGIAALYQLFQPDPNAGYTLSTANRLWVNKNISLLASFVSGSQNTFGAAPQAVDFSNPGAAADTINNWVSQQTNGKIQNLVPASDLNSFTALVITNAIYFKGNWASPFEPYNTQSQPFQIDSMEAATVQMMQQTNDFGYYQQSGPEGFQALDMPYQGGDLDMMVILPTTYNLNQFQTTLTPGLFSKIAANLSDTDVNVQFPQFELDETYDLVQPLKNLGMEAAFGGGADLSGIGTPLPNTSFYISDVIQKTHIQVDETGTEAAAATAVIVGMQIVCISVETPIIPISFDADHPFIFAIRDAATNTILFLGQVTDPSNGAADYSTPATALPESISPPDLGTTGNPILTGPSLPIIQGPADPSPIRRVFQILNPIAPAPVSAAPVAPKSGVRAVNPVSLTPEVLPVIAGASIDSELLNSNIGPVFAASNVLAGLA